ncbi:MAG: trigger factor [Myxococcota bacterium]
MKVRVEELSPIERKLSIEVEPASVAKELDRAYSALSRQVKIAGFRPGKVPRRILEQRFKEQVEDDVIHRVVERAYLEAIREHQVEAVGSPQVSGARLELEKPFAFEARVEVRPKVEAKDYKGLTLTSRDVSVKDAEVEERIEQMRKSLSRLEPVAGRDITSLGDFAVVDYQATLEGKDFPGGKAEGVTMEVTPGELVESNVAALAGVRVGGSKEIDYAFPPDYRVEELRGKTARFHFTVKELKKKVEPALDDELAQNVGAGVETLDELRAKVKSDLKRSLEHKAKNDARDELFQKLIEKNPFEVPKAMVEQATDLMLEGALRAIARGGIDPRRLGLDLERLREEVRPKAEREVKGALLAESVADKEGISATDEDFEKKLEALSQEGNQALSTVRKHFKDPDQKRSLLSRIREEKTIEFLEGQATYSKA